MDITCGTESKLNVVVVIAVVYPSIKYTIKVQKNNVRDEFIDFKLNVD